MFKNSSSQERTNRAKKNILALFVIRGLNILVGLVMVPVTINYLNPTNYGIWVTLTSIVGWFSFFDIGLGHGLRNKFAEAIAKGEYKLAKTYISTTYALLTIIVIVVFIFFLIVNLFVNWGLILNVNNDNLLISELNRVAVVVFTAFCLTLVLNLITVILIADQQPAQSSLFDLIGKTISLFVIYLLTKIGNKSLLSFGVVYCFISPLVLLITTFWLFTNKYKMYRPSLATVNFKIANEIFSLGIKFFIIQIAAILLYQTNNIIISQLFGPKLVTQYNIAFKYFSILMMGFSILITPFWSAFTEAWTKKDMEWIKNTMNKLFNIWVVLVIIGILMLISAKEMYRIWVGDSVSIPFMISFLVMIWMITNLWNGIFSQFLNGTGIIKLQLYSGISGALINVPLAIYLGKIMGIEGVLLSNIIIGLPGLIIYRLQYFRIINNRATGLWNK